MMVVIDLILVLATFALPIYHSIIVHGRETVLREDLFTLRSQIDQFTHDNARAPASRKPSRACRHARASCPCRYMARTTMPLLDVPRASCPY
jgi:Tfp pilus assembly protein PilE